MKADFPNLAKKSSHKRKKEFKSKKVHIAWDDNEVSSSSNSENEECANFALMVSHHFYDEQEVSDYELNDKSSYNKLQNALHELHEECLTLFRAFAKQKKLIVSLESKANDTNVELENIKNSACNKCKGQESKIVELNQVIKKYRKCQIGLEDVLSRQRYSNSKIWLEFSNFDKPNTS